LPTFGATTSLVHKLLVNLPPAFATQRPISGASKARALAAVAADAANTATRHDPTSLESLMLFSDLGFPVSL
jgi:hypothetical protein